MILSLSSSLSLLTNKKIRAIPKPKKNKIFAALRIFDFKMAD